MAFPDTNIISKGASIKCQFLTPNGSRPQQYQITSINPAIVGANSLDLQSDRPVALQHNESLRFPRGATYQAAASFTRGANLIRLNDGAGGLPAEAPSIEDRVSFDNHDFIYVVVGVQTDATEYTLTLNPPLKYDVGGGIVTQVLVEAIVDLPQTDQLNDVIDIPDTGSIPVQVLPISSAIAANTTAQSYALRELLGVSDASPTEAPQTQDATDHKSALTGIQKTVTTLFSKTVTLTGFKIENDRAQGEILLPLLTDPDYLGDSVWLEVLSSDGDFRSGIAQITDSGKTDTVQNLEGYNYTATFVSDTTYVSGDNQLFVDRLQGIPGGFVPQPGVPFAAAAVAPDPTPLDAGNTRTLTVQGTDNLGDPLPAGIDVTFTIQPGGAGGDLT